MNFCLYCIHNKDGYCTQWKFYALVNGKGCPVFKSLNICGICIVNKSCIESDGFYSFNPDTKICKNFICYYTCTDRCSDCIDPVKDECSAPWKD